ncbi:MAG: InlB B-repeat-containing protein [Clostridia bacterium]
MYKKIKCIIVVILIIVSMVLLGSCHVEPNAFSIPTIEEDENYFETEYFTCYMYHFSQGDVVNILGLTERGQEKEEIVIPEKIDGKSIIWNQRAWTNYWRSDKLKKIFIPAGIDVDRSYLFKYCPKLEKLIFLSTDPEEYRSGFNRQSTYGGGYPKYVYEKSRTTFLEYTSYSESSFTAANIEMFNNYENEINEGIYWMDHLEEGKKLKTIPANPIREEYEFTGWYVEKECINIINLEEITMGEETITLYAGWKK